MKSLITATDLLNTFLQIRIPYIKTVLWIVTKSKVIIEHILVLTVTDLPSQSSHDPCLKAVADQ